MIYTYDLRTELFVGIRINQENMGLSARIKLIEQIKPTLQVFLQWAKSINDATVVELLQHITFEMFWEKYNDKLRSSKKRSRKYWDKLSEEDQVKAYYYYDTYNRNRGNAEKKYCETYLNAELWNN